MKENSGYLAVIGSIVGILAGLIAIFTFFTGRSSLPDAPADESALEAPVQQPLIPGSWNEEKANSMVREILESHGGADAFGYEGWGYDQVRHEIIDQYYLNFEQRDSYLVVASTLPVQGPDAPAYDCHACGAALSFIEFRQGEAGWDLGTQSLAAIKFGSWGQPPSADEIRALVIGRDAFGIAIDGGGMNQGWVVTTTRIYADIAGQFREIFEATTSENGEGYGSDVDWNSEIIVGKQSSAPFYDLLLKKRGRGFPESEQEILYQFDGRKYAPSSLYR
jgi:hypothetical protein